jgi:hypothetical protein
MWVPLETSADTSPDKTSGATIYRSLVDFDNPDSFISLRHKKVLPSSSQKISGSMLFISTQVGSLHGPAGLWRHNRNFRPRHIGADHIE